MEQPSPRERASPPGLRRGDTGDKRSFGRLWTSRLLQLGSARSVDSDSLPSSDFGNSPIVVSRGLDRKEKNNLGRLDSAAFRQKLCEFVQWPCSPLPPIDGKFNERLRRARNISYVFLFLSLLACGYIGIEIYVIHLYGLFQSRGKAVESVGVVGQLLPSKSRNIASFSSGLSWLVLFGVLLTVIPAAGFIAFIAYSCSKHDDPRRRSDCAAFVTSVCLRLAIFGGCLSPIFACLSALNLSYRFSSVRQAEPSSFSHEEVGIELKNSSSSSSPGAIKGVASVAVIIAVAIHIPLALFLNHFLQLFEGFVSYLRFCEAMDLEATGADPEQRKATVQAASVASLPDVDTLHDQYSLSAAHQGIAEAATPILRGKKSCGRHLHASTVSNSGADDVSSGGASQSSSPRRYHGVGGERAAPVKGKRESSVAWRLPEYSETSSAQGDDGSGWEGGISSPPRAMAEVYHRGGRRSSGMHRLLFVTSDCETRSDHEEETVGLLESVGRARELDWPTSYGCTEPCHSHGEAELALPPPREVSPSFPSSSSSSSPAATERAASMSSRQSQRQPSSTSRREREGEGKAEEGTKEVMQREVECEGEDSREEGTEGSVSGSRTSSMAFFKRTDFGDDIISVSDDVHGDGEGTSQQQIRREVATSTATLSAKAATVTTAAQEPTGGAPPDQGRYSSPIPSDAEVQSGRPSLSWAPSSEDLETFRSAASHQSTGSALRIGRTLGGSTSSSRRQHILHSTADRGSGRQAGSSCYGSLSSEGATEVAGPSIPGNSSRDENGDRDSSGSNRYQTGSSSGS